MLFHVEMTVKIPHDSDVDFVNELKAKEKAMKELEEIKQIAKEDGVDDF